METDDWVVVVPWTALKLAQPLFEIWCAENREWRESLTDKDIRVDTGRAEEMTVRRYRVRPLPGK